MNRFELLPRHARNQILYHLPVSHILEFCRLDILSCTEVEMDFSDKSPVISKLYITDDLTKYPEDYSDDWVAGFLIVLLMTDLGTCSDIDLVLDTIGKERTSQINAMFESLDDDKAHKYLESVLSLYEPYFSKYTLLEMVQEAASDLFRHEKRARTLTTPPSVIGEVSLSFISNGWRRCFPNNFPNNFPGNTKTFVVNKPDDSQFWRLYQIVNPQKYIEYKISQNDEWQWIKSERGEDQLLINAAQVGSMMIVRESLRRGANINAIGKYDLISALYMATIYGHEAIVRLLLENGAKTGTDGNMGLQVAAEKGYESIVNLLLEKTQPDINSINIAMIIANANNHFNIVRLLKNYRSAIE